MIVFPGTERTLLLKAPDKDCHYYLPPWLYLIRYCYYRIDITALRELAADSRGPLLPSS